MTSEAPPKPWGMYSFLILALLFLFSRLLHLDSDPPIWSISYYCIIDELYYTAYAFDLAFGNVPFDIAKNSPLLNFLQQFVTAPLLTILGNNYYGLRTPSVVAGFSVFSFFYLIIYSRFGKCAAFLFSLLLISEFSFTLATRIAEPTIFRLAAISGLIFLCTKIPVEARGRDLFLLGLSAGCSWLFVYTTNAFAALASMGVVVFWCKNNLARSLIYFSSGILLSLTSYVACIYLLGSSLQEISSVISLGSSRVSGLRHSGTFTAVALENIEAFLRANFITQNPVFAYSLLVSFSLFLLSLKRQHKNRFDKTDVIILIFLGAFILQSLFVNDYPERKLVIIFPLILYVFFLFLNPPPESPKSKKLQAARLISVTIIFGFFSTTTYLGVYDKLTYKYKTAMLELAPLGSVYFVGGWSHAFRLYGSLKPYLNKYTLIHKRKDEYYRTMKTDSDAGLAVHTIEYDNGVVDDLSNIGFYKKSLLLKSDDASYPDIYLFEKK